MPVYEEKLISPLAVRFTQEHIKTIFRDGYVVQDTAAEIEAGPTDAEDYDLVLSAPFPQIEIIRWGHSQCGEGSTGHWFTLDNRRLYCLQVAAMRHWPRRVAAKVDILYADPGAVRRKFDSTTLGASVTVAHSCKDAPLFRWDWRAELRCAEVSTSGQNAARQAVANDDEKITVDMLSNACEGSNSNSILARALEFERQRSGASKDSSTASTRGPARSATPSTSASLEERENAEGAFWEEQQTKWTRTPRGRSGEWNSWSSEGTWWEYGASAAPWSEAAPWPEENTLAASALEEVKDQLRAPSWDGKLRIREWKIRYGHTLGSLRKFLKAQPDVCTVIEAEDGTFMVYKAETPDVGAMAGTEDHDAQASKALKEIRNQLQAPHFDGKLRIPQWKARYGQCLGSIRKFLEARPDIFELVYSDDGTFRVYKADAPQTEGAAFTKSKQWPQSDALADSREALEALAVGEIRAQLDANGEAGSIKLEDWNGRYGQSLGPFKAFLRDRSEQFLIVPSTGRLFKVALVTG